MMALKGCNKPSDITQQPRIPWTFDVLTPLAENTSKIERAMHHPAKANRSPMLWIARWHLYQMPLGRCFISLAIITPAGRRRPHLHTLSQSAGCSLGWEAPYDHQARMAVNVFVLAARTQGDFWLDEGSSTVNGCIEYL